MRQHFFSSSTLVQAEQIERRMVMKSPDAAEIEYKPFAFTFLCNYNGTNLRRSVLEWRLIWKESFSVLVNNFNKGFRSCFSLFKSPPSFWFLFPIFSKTIVAKEKEQSRQTTTLIVIKFVKQEGGGGRSQAHQWRLMKVDFGLSARKHLPKNGLNLFRSRTICN